MHIVIVAPSLATQATPRAGLTPPQLAIHLAASTPVRHSVQILDRVDASLHCTPPADLYVLLWSHAFSPRLFEIAMQLTTCEPLICVWDGPTVAPADELLEVCDHLLAAPVTLHWQQLLTTIEAETHQLVP